MIITIFPVLLGGGFSLFSKLPKELEFELVESIVYLNQLVKQHFRRKKGKQKTRMKTGIIEGDSLNNLYIRCCLTGNKFKLNSF